jgi:hypothetical protein
MTRPLNCRGVRFVGLRPALTNIFIHQGKLPHIKHEVLHAGQVASSKLSPARVVVTRIGRDQSHRNRLAVAAQPKSRLRWSPSRRTGHS